MKVILVKGPIVIDFVGEINIIGASYKNQRIRWDHHKVLPLEFEDLTKIRFIGKTTLIFATYNLRHSGIRLGTTMWEPIFSRIIKRKGNTILVLGSSNAGKSTFSLYLANKFTKLGLHTLLIDGDVGQGDLAPPTCIGSGVIKRQTIDISLIESERMCFVGDIQPSKYFMNIIILINKLFEESRHFDKCIVNTDGFVAGKGLYYKLKLVQTLRPDHIIYLGNDTINESLRVMIKVKGNYSPAWITCKTPSAVIKRSKYERYLKRLDTFHRFFEKHKIYKSNLDLRKLRIFQMNEARYIDRYIQQGLQNLQLNFLKCQNHMQFEDKINDVKDSQFVGLGRSNCDGIIHGFGIIDVSEDKVPGMYATSQNFDCIYLSKVILKGMKERLLINKPG